VLDLIWIVIVGAVVGLIAKLLVPGKDPGGIVVTPLIGIAGAIVATYLGQFLGLYDEGENAKFIGSIVGAIVILVIVRLIRGRPGTPGP
jgi:uncharacterized membrane protein YeaQ/YmgE (transglycosylase-associated protein family)